MKSHLTPLIALPIGCLSMLPFAPVHADCPDGSRQLSETERQTYMSMQEAIKAAIPPAPAG